MDKNLHSLIHHHSGYQASSFCKVMSFALYRENEQFFVMRCKSKYMKTKNLVTISLRAASDW